MRKFLYFSFFVFCFSVLTILAQYSKNTDNLWQEVGDQNSRQMVYEQNLPDQYRIFSLDQESMKQILRQSPKEFTTEAERSPMIITMPMPDGKLERFRVEQSLVVEPELAAKYPELSQTFRGQGIDDPTATVRFDFMPSGFHSMIRSIYGTVIIDPYNQGGSVNYISYYKRDAHPAGNFVCDLKDESENDLFSTDKLKKLDKTDFIPDGAPIPEGPAVTSGTTLRTYRLALAATNEYAVAVGENTVAGTLAAQTTVMNRVNGVYERDVAIRMVMIANNNLIVYAGDNTCAGVPCTDANDPYTNNDGFTMLTQNQANLTAVIGTTNYDIGHVFSTGGGGVAQLNSPCNAANKAQGVTGLPNPVGDPFAIDYVAHEMGHQWGANHTFNATVGSCNGNRSRTSAFEPGSGITIMGYAGICGAQNLAANSIDTFHVKSLEVIVAYSQTGNGNTCGTQTATGNTPPAITALGGITSYNIPKQTPFALTAAATDANGDAITYDWQEYDIPPTPAATSAATTVPNTDADGIARPIFRPYLPTTNPTRTFPSLQYILNNANVPPDTTGGFLTGELLPAITRTMNFQAVARDNRANGGGINTVTVTVNVAGGSGPFAVTQPNTNVSYPGLSTQTVNWNIANTTAAPVSAANVDILLSTDGGQTFPTVLVANTPNDGTQPVVIPNSQTTTARIKVQGSGNIFFDVSDTNFTISAAPTAAGVSIGGRIADQSGTGISRARVSLTNQQGETVSVFTNSFGYYLIEDIPAGETYTVTINHRRYRFNSSVISLTDNIVGFDFTALL